MATPTLKQLRYFEAVARHAHFGQAAQACAISQPALSMQIKDLEAILGMPLFERGPRHVRLTGFGEDLRTRAQDILRAVDDLQDMARAAQSDLAGRLRLGVIPTVAPYLLPALIGRLARTHPGLDLRVRETVTPRLLQELAEGGLDAAIVALPVSEPALTEMPLFTEEFVLVRPLAEADTPVPGAEHLHLMRLMLLEEGHCFRDQALSFCGAPLARPREMLDGSSLSTLVQMVGAGMGITLIPEMAIPVETRSAAVSVARFQAPRPCRTIGMIWRRTSPIADRFQQIAGAVRDTAAALDLSATPSPAA